MDGVQVLEPGGPGWPRGLRPGGEVFNLEVDGTHAYVAGGFVVHNCHHVPATTHSHVQSCLPARYRYGLTATPEREDGLEPLLYATIGPIRYRIGYQELLAGGWLIAPRIVPLKSPVQYLWRDGIEEWHEAVAACCADAGRNKLVLDTAAREHAAGHTVLVLSSLRSHCEETVAALGGRGVQAAVLHGKTPKRERRDVLARFRAGALRCVCASSLADEGLDVPRLDRIILAAFGKAEAQTIQRLGRVMRKCEESGKTDAVLYDVHDRGLEREVYEVSRALDRAIGRGRETVDGIAIKADVSPDFLRCVLSGKKKPTIAVGKRLLAAIGLSLSDVAKTILLGDGHHKKRLRLYRALLDECGVDARQLVLEAA